MLINRVTVGRHQSHSSPQILLRKGLMMKIFFLSTNPMQTIRKFVIKLNNEFTYLTIVQLQTREISGRINTMGCQIKHCGVRNIFNYPIYLNMILIIPSFIIIIKLFILQEFLQQYDPHGVTMGLALVPGLFLSQ